MAFADRSDGNSLARRSFLAALAGGLSVPWIAPRWASAAADPPPTTPPPVAGLAQLDRPPPPYINAALGVSGARRLLPVWLAPEAFDLESRRLNILVVGGLAGDMASVAHVATAARWWNEFKKLAFPDGRPNYEFSFAPCLNPDRLAGETAAAERDVGRGYPPAGQAYFHPQLVEAEYLWRWLGLLAPDLLVVASAGEQLSWRVSRVDAPAWFTRLAERLGGAGPIEPPDALANQTHRHALAGVGGVPAIEVATPDEQFLSPLLTALVGDDGLPVSPARRELQRRNARSPRAIADELLSVYGHALPRVMYQPALVLMARLEHGAAGDEGRAGEERIAAQAKVEAIVAPYFSGEQEPGIGSGSELAGHLIFCELAERTDGPRRERYLALARRAADVAFDPRGQPLPAAPHHSEMSDAVFMAGPLLAWVGRLTGESRYFDACRRHVEFMRRLDERPDGLYRHSPLDEAAWGRGNGFPALGLSLALSHWPDDQPGRDELLAAHRRHLDALLAHQDVTGCWRQVIDHAGAYRELTATAMIAFALARGLRRGWLAGEQYQRAHARAWRAIQARVGAGGQLVDVCTGTGKQRSLRAYLERPAILGRDERGAAMVLLAAVETAAS